MALLDRLLGRQPVADVKALQNGMTGPGALSLDIYPQISSFSRNQNRLMNEALGLYRSHPWVHIAEKTISDRFARLDWHLEDEDGNTIEEKGEGVSPDELAIAELLERPNKAQTRRSMWALLCRHLGLAGNHFWYLDQQNLLGAGALQILPLTPVRLTPRIDSNGNLLGWLLDGPDNVVTGRSGNPGVPLEPNEILHFVLDEPDFGVWGIGTAEAVQTKIELDRLATRHEAQIFASGGRLTGLVTPKPNSGQEVSDEQWKSLVREWRNVASDPDAAKRLIVSKGSVDWVQTSSNNQQLELAELSGQGRDDILNAWGIPLSQVGINKAVGLNSGERNKNDEAILWQGVIEPRVEAFREKVQFELLDRIADSGGPTLQLVIDTPAFDDQTPLFDIVQKSATVAMSNDERRAIIGLDPLDETIYKELGQAVYVLNTMTALYDPTAPEPAPAPVSAGPAPVLTEQSAGPTPTMSQDVPAKATLTQRVVGLRQRLQPTWERKIRAAVTQLLHSQRTEIVDNVRHRYAQISKKPKDTQAWWSQKWDGQLSAALLPIHERYARSVAKQATRTLTAKADSDWMTAVVDRVRSKGGQRITGINDTTRARIQELLEQGVTDGLGPAALGDLIEEDAIFDEARSELIARTESMLVYNDAALGSYSEFGVEEVEAVDGDEDEECAARDGQIFSIDEADTEEDHPNGTLDWVPVVKARDLTAEALQEVKAALTAQAARPIYVERPNTPDVKVENIVNPTPVEVKLPEQPAPVVNVKAALPASVEVTKMPRRVHTMLRDNAGKAKGSVEDDA